MQLNLKTDYSLRVLLYLALYPGEPVAVKTVADAFGISVHHLAKVAQSLGELGVVTMVRGRSGGMKLGRKAEEICLGEVVRAMEGSLVLVECFDAKRNTCVIAPGCGLKGVLREAQAAFLAVLSRYTLADVVRNPGALRGLLERQESARGKSEAQE